jgi:hypothetical protein
MLASLHPCIPASLHEPSIEGGILPSSTLDPEAAAMGKMTMYVDDVGVINAASSDTGGMIPVRERRIRCRRLRSGQLQIA